MPQTPLIFVLMVAAAVFLLAYAFFLPTLGQDRKQQKRLQSRLRAAVSALGDAEHISLVRKKYLTKLSPWERWLESRPGMERLRRLIEQSGHEMPAYRVALLCVAAGLIVWIGFGIVVHQSLIALPVALMAGASPIFKLRMDRARRFAKFDEQLPPGLDTITRALRAGHPFVDALRLVGEEMSDPLGYELRTVFTDINYGAEPRTALLALLERMPSLNVMAVVTCVLIQRETGGNLAEVLEKISSLIRSRFRFHRKVRTLSAEARLSAWILGLIPFVLAAAMWIITPSYIVMLLRNPLGPKLIGVAFVMLTIGVFWMRRIIRIRV